MKVKRFSTYPIAYINKNKEKASDEEGRFYDVNARNSYFRMLEEAHYNLSLALDAKRS